MNKKKILLVTLICIVTSTTTAGIVWSIRLYRQGNDPYLQAAKEICKVQSALQEVDEAWELESLSHVTPFEIKGPDGVTINYYCCITTYLNEEPAMIDGLNKTALAFVVDIGSLENRMDCNVGGWAGIIGELGDLTYLCWTVSPKYSCVIEYTTGTIEKEDIFRMAESVKPPES